ncbi:MAG: RNA-binding S4 domain-containing protein [Porphyromonadaceae bacterium]|nr:RNA-binding S4 domain-containing protein [Porphyromonadaceae bacterium]
MPKEGLTRIDKFLWATRIFKTHTIATEACKKGRIAMGGVNVKPSHPIQIGETIEVRKPPVTYSFKILGLTENRVGAKLVPQYLENVTAPDQYELIDMIRIRGFVDRAKGEGRPTKREGRELKKFIDGSYTDEGSDDADWEADFDFDINDLHP